MPTTSPRRTAIEASATVPLRVDSACVSSITSAGRKAMVGKTWLITRPVISSSSRPRSPLGGGQGGDVPAVAQHGDAVGDAADLAHPVGDVDDADAVRLGLLDQAEQAGRLALGQRGGRLVEDQHR
ncbi:MAG: hypothetical protein U1E53_01305 [Dongiaceae bacterium]